MSKEIKFYQLNLHKCEIAQSNLMIELMLSKDENFICLLQEPHFFGLKPSSANKGKTQIFHGIGTKKTWPRAMIIASKGLKISMVEELTNRDITCIYLHNNQEEIMICSAYQDITYPEVVNNIDKCAEKAKLINKEIIIGVDTNSHSQLWMEENPNQRGDKFEELIAIMDLTVCNVGRKYTFDCSRGKSIIDVTLTSCLISERINNWKVHDEDYLSDHKLISFNLTFDKAKASITRNYNKADWKLFNAKLKRQKWNSKPEYWCKQTINEEVGNLTNVIKTELDKICPEKEVKFRNKTNVWWNQDLKKLRRKVKTKYNEWKQCSTSENVTETETNDKYREYSETRRQYAQATKKAKRSSWQAFTSECKDGYLLDKIIHKKQQNTLSIMEGCNTAIESNEALMDTHFPGSTPWVAPNQTEQEWGTPQRKIKNIELTNHKFLETPRIKEAFNDMKALNAGGPDGMKSIVFQNLPNNILYRISRIYKACMDLSHTPPQWCEANIIFLPKQNKMQYNKPNSFRPISMFNVLLKGLEKLVKWNLERTALAEKPFNKTQHAYSRVKNADTALATLTDLIEKGFLRKKFALWVFLDISGAFNNLNTKMALQAMRNRGFQEHIVSWYESFVMNRVAQSELLGSTVTREINRGTPQGGILSPIMWNVVMDELLEILNEDHSVRALGFSDDLAMGSYGIDETIIAQKLQRNLNKAKGWQNKYQLSMAATKSTAVMFTTKKRARECPIIIDDEAIPYRKQVKYLGVILDSKLKGTEHVSHKIGKAKKHLMAYHYAIKSKFGSHPKLLKKVYKTKVIPALTYGCHIFGDKCQQETTKEKLLKINRLISLLIAPVAPKTPSRGLEIIYHIMPLHIQIEQRATEIMARIDNQIQPDNWDGTTHNRRKGLIQRWRSRRAEITNNIIQTDKIPTEMVKERTYKIHPTKDGRIKKHEVKGIQSYTDGSVMKAKTGCGIHTIKGKRVIYNGNFYLGDNINIYQAEITALKKSAEHLIRGGWENQQITFYSDSQASLAALAKLTITSESTKRCHQVLNELGRKNKVSLKWVKAHIGIHGNEVADTLAKKGTLLGEGPATELLTPKALQKKEIRLYYTQKWRQEWKSYAAARQTKIWFTKPDLRKSQKLLTRNRNTLGILVQFLTGHNKLQRHKNLQEKISDPFSCRLCGSAEETSFHVIAECPVLQRERMEIFKTWSNMSETPEWTIGQVEKFLNKTVVGQMLEGTYGRDLSGESVS